MDACWGRLSTEREEIQDVDGAFSWGAQLNMGLRKTSEEVAFEPRLCVSVRN